MATKVFIGDTATHVGDWQWDDSGAAYATSNWIDNTTGAACAKPADGDTIIFDSRSSAVVDGTAIGETGGIRPTLLHVRSSCIVNIGSASEYLHLEAALIIYEGKGTMYLKCAAANLTTDSSVDKIIVRASLGTVYLASAVNSASYRAKFTTAQFVKGTINIADGTAINTIETCSADLTVTIGINCVDVKNSSAPTDFKQFDGTITTDSPVGTIIKSGGTFNFGTALTTPQTNLDIANIIHSGGTFNYAPVDSSTPTIAAGQFFGGTFKANGKYKFQFGSSGNEQFFICDPAVVDLSLFGSTIAFASGAKLIPIGTGVIKYRSAMDVVIS